MSWVKKQEEIVVKKFQQKMVDVVLAGPFDLVDLETIKLETGCKFKKVDCGK
tara:strand:- start:1355 stop:1510 length:156 start_codon:yes stop_codon:yes gene_type:complete